MNRTVENSSDSTHKCMSKEAVSVKLHGHLLWARKDLGLSKAGHSALLCRIIKVSYWGWSLRSEWSLLHLHGLLLRLLQSSRTPTCRTSKYTCSIIAISVACSRPHSWAIPLNQSKKTQRLQVPKKVCRRSDAGSGAELGLPREKAAQTTVANLPTFRR